MCNATEQKKLLQELYESVSALLQNMYDSGDAEEAESGEIRKDVSNVEKQLAKINVLFDLGVE